MLQVRENDCHLAHGLVALRSCAPWREHRPWPGHKPDK